MSRRQVLVQLDDELVKALDAEAAEEKISRSEALRRAAADWLKRKQTERDDRRTIEAYSKYPQDPADDEMYVRLAGEALEDETW